MYKITFIDGSQFISKSNPQIDSQWNKIPNKPIKKLEYNYLGIRVILEGYNKYNHLVGKANAIFIGKNFTSFIKLLAKDKNNIIIFIWDLIKKEFKKEIKKVDKMNLSTGWKQGFSVNNPTYKINP